MGSEISLRDDFDGTALRQLARKSKRANQAHRLLALAEIYDGGNRTSAGIGGVGLQIVRNWVVRFNARCPEGLLNGKAPGRQSLLNDAHSHGSDGAADCPTTGRKPSKAQRHGTTSPPSVGSHAEPKDTAMLDQLLNSALR